MSDPARMPASYDAWRTAGPPELSAAEEAAFDRADRAGALLAATESAIFSLAQKIVDDEPDGTDLLAIVEKIAAIKDRLARRIELAEEATAALEKGYSDE